MTKKRKIEYINLKAGRNVVDYVERKYRNGGNMLYITKIEEKIGSPFHFKTYSDDQKIATELLGYIFEDMMKINIIGGVKND